MVAVPVVTTTFTSVVTFQAVDNLIAFMDASPLETMQETLVAGSYQSSTVEVTAVIKLDLAYTFPAGTVISSTQCVTAFAAAFSPNADPAADTVAAAAAAAAATCTTAADADAAAAAASAADAADTDSALRRLTDVVVTVQVAYAEAAAAQAGNTLLESDQSSFIDALGDLEPAVDITSLDPPSFDYKLEIVIAVTGSDEAVAPSPADVVAAVVAVDGASSFTVTATVSEAAVTYTIMPCSASEDVCGSAGVSQPTVGCEGAICTAALDAETCCTAAVVGRTDSGAPATCMLGSLVALVLSCKFILF